MFVRDGVGFAKDGWPREWKHDVRLVGFVDLKPLVKRANTPIEHEMTHRGFQARKTAGRILCSALQLASDQTLIVYDLYCPAEFD